MEIIRGGMTPDMYDCGACDSECMGKCYTQCVYNCPSNCNGYACFIHW